MENLLGQGRAAIDLIVDADSFDENALADLNLPCEDYGPGAVVGSARINGEICTVIANDAMTFNPRFPVVYAGVIGLEEGYKMALAVYRTLAMDKDKLADEKRPLVLIVDTPGNGPGKLEEIIGMNKSTGAYQLALAQARHAGHPIIAMVIGRAISGAFLCHGLQADHILSLTSEFGTMIHVMPLSSIARITRQDVERLSELSRSNPVFAAGPEFFWQLGGVEELVKTIPDMKETIVRHIREVREQKGDAGIMATGPQGRGISGDLRGGRKTRAEILTQMRQEYQAVAGRYQAI
ncbi:biotin-independent malonate decarboxylase subunit gamma [Salmonella enterica subsp. salamae]|uniref:Acetyl-CoA carboxylase, carboxyltransferase component (Subunits alpha and beta) n=3 Tax=Salmonella enterica TaxID=28901 RepID=A0A379QFM6_SALER|nr:biotin-independent malonate decarboxylase subunit gamma [Salmonella enterica]ECC1480168.1 biotin-independent malonate decarboxylase subunit gamma [Salmonella enterica subsp. salamae]ASG86609.1 biotin-independent malonate decarboxylase subunit gamma [Salmonella enterica subsp. salamae serovar 55:k:z39 str. 1315K]ECC1655221.1 biotin-independent malonate decarboxylase subunit gamma [Salmonella enterica subsp. salamae]ECD9412418.1 biotin-independent malonate decarboxylase subunit gamma [Salmonel